MAGAAPSRRIELAQLAPLHELSKPNELSRLNQTKRVANTQAPTQDGESFIRIADRDRCKPIASSTCVCIRVCVNVSMSQCKDDAQVHAVVRIVAAPARA